MTRILFTLLFLCTLHSANAQERRAIIDSTRIVVANDYVLYQRMNRMGVPVTQTMELRIRYRVSKFGHATFSIELYFLHLPGSKEIENSVKLC